MLRLASVAVPPLLTIAVTMLVGADLAWAQDAPVTRLNWFWSIFAGFVFGGIALAILAWLFSLTRVHWSIFLVLWIGATLLLRYDTHL